MDKLYKPVIVKKEVDDEHFYFVDGKFHPSVTKILQETMPTPYALRQWLGDVGNEKASQKLESAGERGSAIHAACEVLLQGQELSLVKAIEYKKDKLYTFKDPDKKAIVGFINWANDVKPKVKNIEFPVASQIGYAGTLDLFCEIDGVDYIIDFKTSAAVYDSHKLQIAAYQWAMYEMSGVMAEVGILHLNPRMKKGYSFMTSPEIKDKPVTVEDFRKVFDVYLVLNGGKVQEPDLTDVYPEKVRLYE